MSASEFTLVPTTESDRTYIARLNFLTDVFGDEHADIGADFLEGLPFLRQTMGSHQRRPHCLVT